MKKKSKSNKQPASMAGELTGKKSAEISRDNLAICAGADGDLFDDECKVFPPMTSAEAKSWGGDNASRYVKPVDRDVPCESEFYWWAERAVNGVLPLLRTPKFAISLRRRLSYTSRNGRRNSFKN